MPLPPPADAAAEGLADWLETYLLGSATQSIGAGAARNVLTTATGTTDASAGMALNTMHRRSALLPGRYPFSVNPVGVSRVVDERTVYEALLLMSASSSPYRASAAEFASVAVAFENIVCDAVRGLLGAGATALRFGWPSKEGRPPEFAAAVKWLSTLMGTRLGRAYRPPRRKDGGVDVVGWRRFADKKPGFPIILVQCTLERDMVHKSRDIDRRIWSGWLAFDVDPITALAFPHVVSKVEDWREMASNVIVLDRVRLVSLLASGICSPELSNWVDSQARGISERLD